MAPIIATRKRGDKVLVSEVVDGWVRVSEEDDDLIKQLSGASE